MISIQRSSRKALHACQPTLLTFIRGLKANRKSLAPAILKQDVERLGEAGARVDVKRGYLRNYLVPQKKATQLSFAAAKASAPKGKGRSQQDTEDSERERELKVLRTIAKRLAASPVVVTRALAPRGADANFGDIEPLADPVTRADIAAAVAKQKGIAVSEGLLAMQPALGETGDFDIPLRLVLPGGARPVFRLQVQAAGDAGRVVEREIELE